MKKNNAFIGLSELCKDLLEIFLDQYYKISALKEKMSTKYSFDNLAPDYYDCSQRFEKSDYVPPMLLQKMIKK